MPQQRIKGLKERIGRVTRHKDTATARQLPILVGTVVSMGLAVGPVSRLWTRALYRDILFAYFLSQCSPRSNEGGAVEDCHCQPIWTVNAMMDVIIGSWSEAESKGSSA